MIRNKKEKHTINQKMQQKRLLTMPLPHSSHLDQKQHFDKFIDKQQSASNDSSSLL
jgi:hypothetical protein